MARSVHKRAVPDLPQMPDHPPPVPPKTDVPLPVAPQRISIDASATPPRTASSRKGGRPRNVSEVSAKDAAIPKHMKSTSSRFSFDMIGAAEQERLLEDRHRQKALEKKAGKNDDEEEDEDADHEETEDDEQGQPVGDLVAARHSQLHSTADEEEEEVTEDGPLVDSEEQDSHGLIRVTDSSSDSESASGEQPLSPNHDPFDHYYNHTKNKRDKGTTSTNEVSVSRGQRRRRRRTSSSSSTNTTVIRRKSTRLAQKRGRH